VQITLLFNYQLSHNMTTNAKYTFEVHTMHKQPMYISFQPDLLVKQCCEIIIEEVESFTGIHKCDILDIFAEDVSSNATISTTLSQNRSLKEFVGSNRNFFPISPVTKNLYRLFVMDNLYLQQLDSVDHIPESNARNNQIKTSHWSELIISTKKLIYL